MYLLGDAATKVQPPESEEREKNGAASAWLRKRSKILDRVLEPERDQGAGLATFSARIS